MTSSRDPQEMPPDDLALPRAQQATRLRLMGWTYEEIAHRCQYGSARNARRAVKNERAKRQTESDHELIFGQLDLIDIALKKAVMPKVERGDLWAVDRLGMLLKRQAELMGIDRVKTDVPAQNVRRTYELVRSEP